MFCIVPGNTRSFEEDQGHRAEEGTLDKGTLEIISEHLAQVSSNKS
ncbi:4465_t:CDS:2 [Funneliformis geosporum]|uniref:4465_t:CDS:1 n=1 Tax=Funneliformis geosporum TaxID=1117311 RepID=A0A9W4WKJ7_9GLOM|nr:4465_t:CDS:2 [Funneliformis geosporum]